ncbi:hypothetical protein ACFPVX_05705 [Cohnella faecalis]|uniref:hypothetical protein n=1 Tax=Cohnella faecalis TaxID=2315694 RepID=UPI0013149C0A|nr:hypothetical protein [Cohnella faecalis]
MDTGDYRFAELQPDQVNELREAERSLSAKTGHPITLIAFNSEGEHPKNGTSDKSDH